MLKHILVFLAIIAVSWPAMAQPAASPASGHGQARIVAETRALMVSLNEEMDRQQARLKTDMREASVRAKWTEEERVTFMRTIFRSRQNADFDKQIASLTAELRGMQEAAQRSQIRGAQAEYRYVARLRELLGQLKSVYAAQSAYFTRQLRKAK